MTVSDRLLKAILSMDSYNRGYGTGINLTGTKIGNATIGIDSSILKADDGVTRLDIPVGFYAISYTLSSGETVISYRGTNADDITPDVIHGYWTGGGIPGDAQSVLALKFYYEVLTDPSQLITLTGHSLGGGLAGYVGAINAKEVNIYDNMTYEDAARSVYDKSHEAYMESLPIFSGTKIATEQDIALWHSIYGNNPPSPLQFIGNYIYTEGELLQTLLPERVGQHTTKFEIKSYAEQSNLTIIDLHSIALLSTLIYAEDNHLTDWQKAAGSLLDAMFNDDVGSALGLRKDSDNVYGPAQQMLSMIAYSAIDEGDDDTNSRPFGDTGIKAMFDDANDLGNAFGVPAVSQTLQDTSDAISDILVQFAGQLARGKVLQTDTDAVNENVLQGVLTLSDDQKTLSVDLSSELWRVGINTGKIYGQDRLMEEFSSVKNEMQTAMQWLWNDEFGKLIDKIEFPTGDMDVTTAIADRTDPSNKVSLFIAPGGSDYIVGSVDNNFIYGGNGEDVLRGDDGDDLLAGGDGDDRLSGGAGHDFLAGGAGVDTAFYEGTGAITLNVKAVAPDASRFTSTIELNANGDIDRISGVEKVELSNADDTVIVTKDPKVPFPTNVVFDGMEGNDTLSYAGSGVTTSILEVATPTEQLANGLKMEMISNIENIQATAGNDTLNIGLLTNTKVTTIDTGAGNDKVWVFGSAVGSKPVIDLGAGDDVLENAPRGAVVYGGTGNDTFNIGKDYLIADADANDIITNGTQALHGGVTWRGQESPWAVGLGGIKYAKNDVGELVIQDRLGDQTFVSNYSDGTDGPRTAGLLLGQMSLDAYHLFHTPNGAKIYESFEAIFGDYLKAMTGKSYFTGVDPLVLDLDGDGVELSPRGSLSPYFDVDADGFGEQTGWVRPDDGILVRDINNNGKIDNVSEMFGSAGASGFTALAALDSNNDGIISSADSSFVTLQIWRDLNSDGITDAGELETLTQAGIASINLTSTVANQNVAGNVVTATGSFTRTDNTTGTIADVDLRTNQRDTVWLGDKTVDAAAAALPELKGFGTLNNLRIAMTDSAALKSAVQAALPDLGALDLANMRTAITPVLNAWRDAVPVPAGTPGTETHVDVPILTETTLTGTQVDDFAYQVTDAQGSYWKLASGAAVKDSSGADINRPTFADVMAQTSTQGSWTSFSGAQIQFLERYLGTELPIGVDNFNGGASISAAQGLISQMWETLNDVAVRLAVQGPLASFFPGIQYNPDTNNFEATTDHQIAPAIEAILNAAPADAAGTASYLKTWKPILDVFLQSFDRNDSYLEVSYAFLFQNVVAAYEDVSSAATLEQVADALGLPVDLIHTGAGTVVGSDDADLFYLGTGDQTVQGGLGPDTYVVGKNFGHDIIDDVEDPLKGSPDALRFAHLNSAQVSMARDGLDLVITETGTQNDLRIIGQFAGQRSGFGLSGLDPDHGVQEIIFANGEVWDKIDITKAVSTHTDGDDIINGTDTIDFLDGGKGNDILNGGGEGDIYSFGIGDGQDIIYDNIGYIGVDTPDILQFKPGLTLDMVSFTREGTSNDLVIKINGTDDQVTVKDQFSALYTGVLGTQWVSRIEGFSFDDGTTVSWDQAMDMVIQSAETSGNDIVYGFSRSDTLDGGAGDDYLSGGEDSDLYIMGLGYGHDTIEDNRTNLYSGDNDTLQFLEGVDPTTIQWSRGADYEHRDDLTFTLEDGSSVTIKQQFFLMPVFDMDINRIEFVDFADGTEWTSDYIKQHMLDISSTSGNDTIYGYLFSDDTINGGDGDDYIDGLSGNDTIIGGKGNDILANDGQLNETGNTTYIHNLGDGIDTIREGGFAGSDTLKFTGAALTSTNAIITRSDDLMSATISFAGVADKIILDNQFGPYGAGVENIVFSDGVTWTKDDLQKKYLATVSTAGNDTIYGFGSNINDSISDIIAGGKGDDYMNGLMGDDLYIHNQGDGVDTIFDDGFSGNDTLQFTGAALTSANAILTRSDSDVYTITIGFAGVADKVILSDEFGPYGEGIENITFSNGVTWTKSDLQAAYIDRASTDGNDSIYGFLGRNDTIIGGKGDDYMAGLDGDDTYIHNQGDGIDTINEYWWGGGNDTLKLTGTDLTSTNFTLAATGTNLLDAAITFGGVSDKITLIDQLNWSPNAIEKIIFSDGVTLNSTDLITGSDNNDTITGNDNNNFLFGFAGNDTISGGLGDDTLNGGDGADVLDGGVGSDTASYIDSLAAVNVNLGITTAQSGGDAAGDTLIGIENIIGSAYNDTLTGNSADNILIGGAGADAIDGGAGIDTVSYATSSSVVNVNLAITTSQDWGAAGDTIVNVENLIGSAFGDTLSAATAGSVIHGGDGDDNINGAAGNDTLYGDAGNDTIYAGDGDDTIYGGSGDDTIFSQGGNNLIIGGAGADLFNGFAGVATATYVDSSAAVNINLLTNVNTGGDAQGDMIYGVQNIIGSNFDDTILGNTFSNSLYGGDGNDLLAGIGYGGNHMDGGAGIDTVSYKDSYSVVNVNLGITTSQDWGASGDTIVNVENLIGSDYDDNLTAAAGGSSISGGDGWDTISGAAGNDILHGDEGNDSIYGNDGNDVIYGDAGDDTLWGQAGNNILIGGAGADTIMGYGGISTASYATSGVAVSVNMDTNVNSGGDADGDYLGGITNLIGSAFADTLVGNYLDNTITGGAGADMIDGSTGVDTVSYLDSAAAVNVNLGITTAQSGGDAQGDTLFNIENVVGSSYDDILTAASTGDNLLTGSGGNDNYVFGSTFGHDTINNVSSNSILASGKVTFDSGITSEKLWFVRSGKDLQVDLLGTTDTITISNWYDINPSAQVASFNTSDGLNVDAQIAQLVSAMASYGAGNPGFNPQTASTMPTDTALQDAITAAWHS